MATFTINLVGGSGSSAGGGGSKQPPWVQDPNTGRAMTPAYMQSYGYRAAQAKEVESASGG